MCLVLFLAADLLKMSWVFLSWWPPPRKCWERLSLSDPAGRQVPIVRECAPAAVGTCENPYPT